MRRIATAFTLASCLACGSSSSSPLPNTNSSSDLAVVLPHQTLHLVGGERTVIQLLAVGTGDGPVTFSADGPAFVSLNDATLTVAPTRADAGSFTVNITARAGQRTATASLSVDVTAPNGAPTVSPSTWFLYLGDDAHIYGGPDCTLSGHMCCPGPACTLGSNPRVYVEACDADGDALTVDVQVVPANQALANVVSGSLTEALDAPQSAFCSSGLAGCACFAVPLKGLAPSTAYAFAVRVTDALGAVARKAPPYSVDDAGWIHDPSLQFRTAP